MGQEPNRPISAIQTLTTGRLPGPVANPHHHDLNQHLQCLNLKPMICKRNLITVWKSGRIEVYKISEWTAICYSNIYVHGGKINIYGNCQTI